MAIPTGNSGIDKSNYASPLDNVAESEEELESILYARHAEIKSYEDLTAQRGTQIPALFNQFYKFIQNPSTVSVETFKRMVDTDETIGSGIDFLTMCMAARIGAYEHESKEITEWVNKRLNEIEGGYTNLLKEILSATWAGFSVHEVVWANTDNGFVPKKCVHLPPVTLLFETERTGEITSDGILQYQRNFNPALQQSGVNYLFGFSTSNGPAGGSFRPDVFAKYGDFSFPLRTANTYTYLSIRIPKEKCIHYAFDAQGRFQSPYGRSLLRRIYKYYVSKDSYITMMSIALDRKGTPLTVVFANQHATMLSGKGIGHGTNQADMVRNQTGRGISAAEAAREAFRNIHNDTTIILPGKKDEHYGIDFVPQDSNTSSFIEALKFCNQGMLRGLLVPSLIFTSGDGTGSFALGQEHAKTFDKIVDSMNAGLNDCLLQQLVKPMIKLNFPEDTWKKEGFGSFSKRELSQDEIQKEMDVISKAVEIGAVDMNEISDLNKIRDKMGFEPRDTIIEKPEMPGMDGENQQDPKDKEDLSEKQKVNLMGRIKQLLRLQ